MEKKMLSEFYDRYSKEIYLYLYSLCRSHEAAEDLMQEAFLKAMLFWKDNGGNLRAWLYKVARNACMNYLRDTSREIMQEESIRNEMPKMNSPSPLQVFLDGERNRLLYQGMLTLPLRQREILELFYFSEMSVKEIAVIMKLSMENVRVLAYRARKTLKNYMEVNGYDL